MSVNSLSTPLSGMNAAQFRQHVTANHVANVSTPGFQPAQTRTADAAYINGVGQGTRAAATPATYAPQRPAQTPAAQPAQAAQSPAQPAAPVPQPNAPVSGPSNVDMITETANRMQAQSAYGANMSAARSMNGMTQTLMDMVG